MDVFNAKDAKDAKNAKVFGRGIRLNREKPPKNLGALGALGDKTLGG
jgi:hypothetical protein